MQERVSYGTAKFKVQALYMTQLFVNRTLQNGNDILNVTQTMDYECDRFNVHYCQRNKFNVTPRTPTMDLQSKR